MDATASTPTFSGLRRAVVTWVRKNLPRAIVMSAVSFAFGWLVNVFLLAVRYEGFAVPSGTKEVATGQGTMIAGSVFWAAASTVGFALFAYTRKVGPAKVMEDLRSLPTVIKASLAGDEKDRTLATMAWGAALSLVVAIVIGPGAAGIVAVGMAVFATTPIGQILAGVVRRLWMSVLTKFSPTAGAPLDGVPGAIASAVGTAAGMAVAFVFTSTSTKLLLAAMAAGAAWLLVGRDTPPAATTVVLGVLGGLFFLDFIEAARVFADDGGWAECGQCNLIDWVTSAGATEVVGRSVVGATAAGVGAPVGTAIGEILAGGGDLSGGPGPDGRPEGGPDVAPTDPAVGSETPDAGADAGGEGASSGSQDADTPAADDTTSDPEATPDPAAAPATEPPSADDPTAEAATPVAESVIPPKPTGAPPRPVGPPPGAPTPPVDTLPAAAGVAATAGAELAQAVASDGEPAAPVKEGEPGWTEWAQAHIGRARDALESDPEDANTWLGWARNTAVGTVARIADEIVDIPNQVVDAVIAGAELGGKVVDAVQDPDNWDVIYEGTEETVADVINLVTPGADSSDVEDKIRDGLQWAHDRVEDAGTIAGTLYAAAEQDPMGAAQTVAETVLNKENWDKAMDPDVPILERTGRAVWGAIDNTMTLAGIGGAGMAAVDKVGDVMRGAQALDKGVDAARTTALLDDLGRAAASGADEAGALAGKTDDLLAAAAGKSDDAAAAASKADDAAAAAKPRTPKEAAEARIRDLDEGDMLDGNFISDTGYTGSQVNGEGKMVAATRADGTEVLVREKMGINDITRKHDISAEARTTNYDSMRRVRDGEAVPKPLDIKPKTVGADDVKLGYGADDQGLVGYRQPTRPSPADFDDPADYERVMERWVKRDDEWRDKSMDMFRLEQEGKVFVDRKTGVVFDVKTGKPYAGDIDAVVFRNRDGSPVSRDKYLEIMDDWTDPSNAVKGQHGAEAQLINDLTDRYGRGTPEFNKALDKAIELHGTLEDAHNTEQVISFADGIARKGPNYYGRLVTDVTPEVAQSIDAARAARYAAQEAAAAEAARRAAGI